MSGCSKKVVKNTIEVIGQYLIDNSERIAGDFDTMTEFGLEINFKTNDEEIHWPIIRFTNQHYLPYSSELYEKILESEEK